MCFYELAVNFSNPSILKKMKPLYFFWYVFAAGAAGGPPQCVQGLTWRGTYGTKLPQDRQLSHKATPPSSPALGEATRETRIPCGR